jgi:hypothetical protein
MKRASGGRKEIKFKKDICYFCGASSALENEDIPGKQFGVTAQTGGLLLPVCRRCNAGWNKDQEFFRLRIVMHAGSRPGAHYIKDRELSRLRGTDDRKPQVGRYLKERSKTYVIDGDQLDGLTDSDFQRINNVLRHWCAGIHYANRKALAALPGSVTYKIEKPAVFDRLNLPSTTAQEWKLRDGKHFGRWWFLPGPEPVESITVLNLLRGESLWFLVRFPTTSLS